MLEQSLHVRQPTVGKIANTQGVCATNDSNRNPPFCSPFDYSRDDFALERAFIKLAFTGDDPIGPR